jgi:hypothetical protein
MTGRIYFEDECPRIGCGWRTVHIRKGRKWGYITDVASGRRQRVKLRVLEQLGFDLKLLKD